MFRKSPGMYIFKVIKRLSRSESHGSAKGAGDATADKSKVDAVYKINLKVSTPDFAKLEEARRR